ncbi:hypothetical protein SNE40_002383 [Patella caerulea]|uniref:Myelin regulatory factor n=1 Tax=Patella caerulea TaxID=87958 RepID=A0AAN8QE72_PATCE
MDVLGEEQALQAVLGRAVDLGIDNDGLDFQQLEDYISGENNLPAWESPTLWRKDNRCLPDDGIPAIAYGHNRQMDGNCLPGDIKLNAHLRIQPHLQNGPNTGAQTMYCSVPHNFEHYMRQTPLPDSPPDSGSEPYSPHDGQNLPHIDPKHGHGHVNGMTSLQQPPPMYPQNHGGMNMPLKLPTSTYMNEPPKLNHLPQQQLPPTTMHQVSPPINHPVLPNHYGVGPMNMNNPTHKKRKYSESPNSTINSNMMNNMNGLLSIKQEPPGANFPGNYAGLPDCTEDDYSYDMDASGSFMDSSYQVIKWQLYQTSKWAILTDSELKDLPQITFRVDADKGFNYSTSDESFVCQKKNHFQVTVHMGMHGHAKYVRTPEGVKKIDNFCLHFKGIKMESPTQSIKVEQSQSDRSKKAFNPIRVDLTPEQVTKVTVGRLHFSETTSNNMRKKGKPNPDQRYFMLVVSLHAHCADSNYMVAASNCERIIVRASNPGQFDSDVDVLWQKGHTQESAYHVGKVGVNTDHPEEALTVHGNIRLTGHLMQPSDVRAKENFKEVNSKEQKENVEKIMIYKYNYSEDFAETANLPPNFREDTGVIAQEIREILPDAVQETGDVTLPNGLTIDNFLVVDKDRIFMENVGAVKELCKLTDNLEIRIDELETMNTKLLKLKRYDSLKSTASFKSCSSISTVSSSQPQQPTKKSSNQSSTTSSSSSNTRHHHHHHSKSKRSCSRHQPPVQSNMCSNRFIQITIIILILIMAFCLVAITTLYIIERHKTPSSGTPNLQAQYHHTFLPGPTLPTTAKTRQFIPTAPESKATQSQDKPTSATSVLPPTRRPIISAYPVCGGECEQLCCPSPFADDQPMNIDVNNSGQGEEVPDIPGRKAVVIDLPTDDNGQKVINNNDSQNPPYHVINNSPNVVRYRVRRSTDTTTATIKIKELNFTIGNEYCSPGSCSSHNYTYFARLSPYFGYGTVTLQFLLTSQAQVMMCNNYTKGACPTTQEQISSTSQQSQFGQTLEWPVSIGQNFITQFKFRISQDNNHQLCSLPNTDASTSTYIEYNIHFTRTCSRAEEEK